MDAVLKDAILRTVAAKMKQHAKTSAAPEDVGKPMKLKPERIREDFPFFQKNKHAIYFDNACMSLKPKQVIDAVIKYYSEYPGCGGRSVHRISNRVTEEFERSRRTTAKFFNAKKPEEIIFTKNTTESINLVARSLGINKTDTVLTTDKEHNSNLLPWQVLGCRHIPLNSKGDNTFDMQAYEEALEKNKIKLVSMVHTSNLDGTTVPAKEIIKKAHKQGALVLLDAAQSAPHKKIDVKELDVDFLACSGHKMLGPTATGILYGKKKLLEELKPFIVGGETVTDSTYETYTLEEIPHRFEAGLQHYSGVIGLGEAVKYLQNVGLENIQKHEEALNKIITEEVGERVNLIGPKDFSLRGGVYSFNIKGMTPHSIAIMLDSGYSIFIRSGAHCVHSWFNKHHLPGSARVSLYLYNTEEEAKKFVDAVKKMI